MDVEIPPELTEFLTGIKLQSLGEKLVELGYDYVDDFASFDEPARERLRAALIRETVSGGHADRLVRAIAKRAAQPAIATEADGTPAKSQAQPLVQPPSTPPTPAMSAATVVQAAALAVGAASASVNDKVHAARVQAWIVAQEAINPTAPRFIYGRGSTDPIKPFEEAMNAAAVPLLRANPKLVSFASGRVKPGPLMDAAKLVASTNYQGWAKAGGSRAGGAAGEAGHRGNSPKGALNAPPQSKFSMQASAASKLKQSRITGAVRASELELLPRQILDANEAVQAKRALLLKLRQRGTHEDLTNAVQLSMTIAKDQSEVCRTPQNPQPLADLSISSSRPRLELTALRHCRFCFCTDRPKETHAEGTRYQGRKGRQGQRAGQPIEAAERGDEPHPNAHGAQHARGFNGGARAQQCTRPPAQ